MTTNTPTDDEELPPVYVGDHVVDRDADPRDDSEAVMLVVSRPERAANEFEFDDGTTVADVNPDYPACDSLVSIVFPQRTSTALDTLRDYAYPRSRLRVVASTHETTDDEVLN